MSISFVGASSARAPNLTSAVVIPKPTGAALGQVALAVVRFAYLTVTPVIPSGWAEVISVISSPEANLRTFVKVLGGSEPSTYSFHSDQASSADIGGISVYSGVDTSTIFSGDPQGRSTTTASGFITCSAGTALEDGCAVIRCMASYKGNGNAETIAAGSSHAQRFHIQDEALAASGITVALSDRFNLTAGSTGTSTHAIDPDNASWISHTVVLLPAGAGGGGGVEVSDGVGMIAA